jgi:5-methylcytosine-specific restriction enzyme subunit McrC
VSRSAACRAAFPEVVPARVVTGLFERIPRSRAAARYRDALALARLILERHAPELLAGGTPVFALLFDMNILWERFVAALFRRAAPEGIRVSTQEGTAFWKPAGAPERRVRPDIVVRAASSPEVLLIADTKWRVPREGAPDDEELKQMFVYNQLFASRRAVLLYPSEGARGLEWTGRYARHDHTCGALRLGLFDGGSFSMEAMRSEIKALLASL